LISMTYVSLPRVFDQFCSYFDGKMKWSAAKDSEWTKSILSFFSDDQTKRENLFTGVELVEVYEYMGIDYVWRISSSSGNFIELAVEHENTGSVRPFLEQEVRHLVDLKADNKIAITYPHIGDEETLMRGVYDLVKSDMRRRDEKYLVLLGFATKTGEPPTPAILFKGHFIDVSGNETLVRQKVIKQAVT